MMKTTKVLDGNSKSICKIPAKALKAIELLSSITKETAREEEVAELNLVCKGLREFIKDDMASFKDIRPIPFEEEKYLESYYKYSKYHNECVELVSAFDDPTGLESIFHEVQRVINSLIDTLYNIKHLKPKIVKPYDLDKARKLHIQRVEKRYLKEDMKSAELSLRLAVLSQHFKLKMLDDVDLKYVGPAKVFDEIFAITRELEEREEEIKRWLKRRSEYRLNHYSRFFRNK